MINNTHNRHVNMFKKVIITFFCVLLGAVFGADTVTCRGNYFLDIESNVTKRDILYCFVDSDATNGFELIFDFDNAEMVHAGAATIKTYSNMYVQVPSTSELATGLSISAEEEIGIDSIQSGSDFVFKTTGSITSGTTSGLLVKIVATWSKEASLMAGFYKDNVSVSVSAQP
ncbi:MAG: hypothetical protein OCC49_15280 [Fibrobacterales bacterium]